MRNNDNDNAPYYVNSPNDYLIDSADPDADDYIGADVWSEADFDD